MNESDGPGKGDSPPISERSANSGVSAHSNSSAPVIHMASVEKKPSFSNRREYRKMDSIGSSTSEALDFLADMCVEIDEIESALAPSPPPDMVAPARRIYGQNSGSNIFRVPSPRGPSPRGSFFKKKSSESSVGNNSLDGAALSDHSPPLAYPPPIQMKVIDLGNKQIHLIPANDADVELILSLLAERGCSSQLPIINISLEMGDASQYSPKVSGRGGSGTKLINPKHIYKTACDTYRVQMSKGSKTNPNGKFSRNTRSELDALWLCEFALILIDRPTGFDDILLNGNFKCLLQRGIVSSPEDFADKMHIHMIDLSGRGLLKPHEVEKLMPLMEKYIPQHYPFNDHSQQHVSSRGTPGSTPLNPDLSSLTNKVATSAIGFQYATSPPSSGTGSKIIEKARGSIAGLGSMISTQSGSFHDLDRKKRRRVPQPPASTQTVDSAEGTRDSMPLGGEVGGGWLRSGQPMGAQDPNLSQLTSQYVRSKHDCRGQSMGEPEEEDGEGMEQVFPYDANDM